MAKQVINRGTVANDGTGESPFSGMGKINDNFTELYNKDAALDIDLSKRVSAKDGFKDVILAGLSTPVPASGLVGTLSAGNGYVDGTRVEKTGTTTITYAASSDTYNDIDSAGTVTQVVVANGGTPAAVVTGRVRLEKVVTSATAITSVTRLAPDRVLLMGVKDTTGNVTGLTDPSGVNPYGFAVLPKDASGNAVASVNHRTGLLSDLLALDGGNGEISVATDNVALVRHTGVLGQAKAFTPHEELEVSIRYPSPGLTIAAGTTAANTDGAVALHADINNTSASFPISNTFAALASIQNCYDSLAIKANVYTTGSSGQQILCIGGSVATDEAFANLNGVRCVYADVYALTGSTAAQFINNIEVFGASVYINPDVSPSAISIFGGRGAFNSGPFVLDQSETEVTYLVRSATMVLRLGYDEALAKGMKLGSDRGTFDRSYQRVTSGTALAVTGGSVIVDFAGAATLTLTLPANPIDGQDFEVSNQVAFSAGNIVVTPNAAPTGQTIVLGTLATPAAGANAAWRYVNAVKKWCRIR